MDYKVGDTIEYVTFGGGVRRVTVTQREADVKNGYPGFDGIMADGMTVWGYDDQIERVISRS